jgi:hypothetical protein
MEISPACKRTIKTWTDDFVSELGERVRELAGEGFRVESIDISPERNKVRMVQVFSTDSVRIWWQCVSEPHSIDDLE